MERLTRARAAFLVVLFLLVLGFYSFKLYNEQIIKTGGNTDNTSTFTTYTRVKAARGDILDCNGNVLVQNRASFDLDINHFVLISADGTNDHLYRLVNTSREQGIEYTEHFPVTRERPFTYTLSEQTSAWQSNFQIFLAEKASLDSDITAPLLVQELREYYKIPAEWTDEEARLVIGLRYELDLRGCVPSLPNYVFLEDASDEQLSAVSELNIPGVYVEASTKREVCTEYAAHILGFCGPMDPEQWEYYQNIEGYEMDAEVGQDGIEKAFEEYLHGTDGLRMDVVTTDGTLVSSTFVETPKAGANVSISIDINLQMTAEDALSSTMEYLRSEENPGDGHDAEGAAIVALDVKTGKVLICGSYPTYDLSRYFEDYNAILEMPYAPLVNRALQAVYPPGSTYKMSMVVAGIDSHKISANTTIEDKGVFNKYDGFEVNCLAWTNGRNTHGKINAAEALKYSCNYFFYDLGDRIALSAMDSTAKGLGLGERTGVELPEYIGHRANEETKAELYSGDDAEWYQGNQIQAAIGQSDNLFSPMQLAVYTATLANQGVRYRATFLNRVVSADYRSLLKENSAEILNHLPISDEAYEAYKTGMVMVTSESGGTAYSAFRDYPIAVAGKTGTAQNGKTGKSDNGAFVCYAPADDPQIAIAVYGEMAGHGTSLTSVARDILDVYFDVDEIGDVNSFENQLS